MAEDDNRKVIGLPEPVQNNSPATLKTLLDKLKSGLDGIKLIEPELESPNVSGSVTVSNTLVIIANSSTNQFSSNSDFNFIIHNNSVFTIKDDRALVGNNIVYHTGNYDPNLQFAKIAMRITAMEEVPINWISEITDSFDSSNGIAVETRSMSANTNNLGSFKGYTVVNRGFTLTPGDIVKKIGWYQNVAIPDGSIKIAERLSAGSYQFLWKKDIAHPGGGPFEITLDPPFQLPANGEFYIGVYAGGTTASDSTDYIAGAGTARALSAINANTSATNTAISMAENTSGSIQQWVVTTKPIGSDNIVSANTGYIKPVINLEYEYPPAMGANSQKGITITASAQQSGYPVYAAFNKVDSTAATSGNGWFTSNGGTSWPIWAILQLPVARKFTKYALTAQPSTWFTAGYTPKDWTIQGSNDGTTYTIIDTRANISFSAPVEKQYFDIADPDEYFYYKINITANAGGNNAGINELRFWTAEEVLAANVVSQSFDLGDVTPDTVDLIALVEPIDSLTLNTDLKAYITIDEANTWSEATLTQIDSAGSIKMLRDQKIDVSDQTGTKIRWRITSPTAKNFKLHDIYVRPYVKE